MKSPGINIKETQQFTGIPFFAFSAGALVGTFEWGPVLQPILISDEPSLVRRFGRPKTSFNIETWFTGSSFLRYSNAIFIVNINNGNEAIANVSNLGSVATYSISEYSTSSSGEDATFSIEKSDGEYSLGELTNSGSSYSRNDTLTILGSKLGGQDSTNDATVTINSVNSTGEITEVSISGTASNNDYSNTEIVNVSAKYPGTLGNSIRLVICNTSSFDRFSYRSLFDRAPDLDHVHIVVEDTNGSFSDVERSVLQSFENLSLAPGSTLSDGTNNYILDVLDLGSSYFKFTANSEDWVEALKQYFSEQNFQADISFENGTNGSNETDLPDNRYIEGYDTLKSKNDLLFSFVLLGKCKDSVLPNYVIEEVCEKRKDCIALISPPRDTVVRVPSNSAEKIVEFADSITSSSYGIIDTGYKYLYDKYNDLYQWIPLNGDIGGVAAQTDFPWNSPAGYQNGLLKDVIRLAYNPSKADRDFLYVNRVDPVITIPSQGTFLFGDKTLLSQPSAFDRINVRRLFIALEVAISAFAKSILFEANTEYTRTRFVNNVQSFLKKVEETNGIYEHRVVCDETNNTPPIIDRNNFVADVYVKPSRSVNFIQLSFTSLNSDVEVQQYVNRF